MHELSLCGAIASAVTARAGDRRVTVVRLRVGALRQVVPDTLAYCWELTADGPVLAGSRLEIEAVPALVACPGCGAREELSRFVLRCPQCAGPVRVVAGDELLIVSIDIEQKE